MKILWLGLNLFLFGCSTKTTSQTATETDQQASQKFFQVRSLGIRIPKTTQQDPQTRLTKNCRDQKLDNACFVLGAYFEENKQMQTALEYYRLACEKEHMRACLTLGSHLLIRYKQYAQAKRIFEKTCAANNPIACHNLGHAQLQLQERSQAQLSFQKACQLKFKNACIELAYQYLELADDERKAPKYLKLSLNIFKQYCHPDDLVSCNQAGDIAILMKDWDQAKAIYSQGCDWGDKRFCSLAQRVMAQ